MVMESSLGGRLTTVASTFCVVLAVVLFFCAAEDQIQSSKQLLKHSVSELNPWTQLLLLLTEIQVGMTTLCSRNSVNTRLSLISWVQYCVPTIRNT